MARTLELVDQLVALSPPLSSASALVLADPSSVASREAVSAAFWSSSERTLRSAAEIAEQSRRLVSVDDASRRCRLRHSRCPSGDRRGSSDERRVSG
jgi:tryptophan 2,3-dioxygenase